MTEPAPSLPPAVSDALERANRLEKWTLVWLGLIVLVMGLAGSGSQAFKTAWIEDMLSLIAPVLFLISRRVEKLEPREGFPYGFHRAASLAFFFSAAALFVIGGYLLYEGATKLVSGAHPTIGSWRIAGHEVWIGWIMMAALVFSVIPPVILGRKKREIAHQLRDKTLYTDADTNAADWQTGVAGIAGIIGIAFGLWWADAAMAVLISLSILRDGIQGLRIATISLLDGAPRKLDSLAIDPDAKELQRRLTARYPGHIVQVRETGRHMRATVEPCNARHVDPDIAETLLDNDAWRLVEVSKAVRGGLPDEQAG